MKVIFSSAMCFLAFVAVQAQGDHCAGDDGTSTFDTWFGNELSREQCSWKKPNGQIVEGTCTEKSDCDLNGGEINLVKNPTPGTTTQKKCSSNGPSHGCCSISRTCTSRGFTGNWFPVKPRLVVSSGHCMNPAYCPAADSAMTLTASPAASGDNVCGTSQGSWNVKLTCCVSQRNEHGTSAVRVTKQCPKRYTWTFRNIVDVLFGVDELTTSRIQNFLPFVMANYESLFQRRCAPLGDCAEANYLAFSMFLLIDLSSAKPAAIFDDILKAVAQHSPHLPTKIQSELNQLKYGGQLTPESYEKFLNILWTDRDLNLVQFNSATCADWIQLSRIVGRDWPCNERWEKWTRAFKCVPSRVSNLPDCANGKGVCMLYDSTTPVEDRCDIAVAYNGDCKRNGKQIQGAVCCIKKKPSDTTMQFLHNEYHNVRVALDPAITQDEAEQANLLATLKEKLEAASKKLYTATEQRAFIRSWKVIVPYHWTGFNVTTSSKWTDSEIILYPNVASADQKWSNKGTMNTIQISMCGSRGYGTHMNIKDVQAATAASNIAKHFAFNRYGIFPEFPRNELETNAAIGLLDHRIERCVKDINAVYTYCDGDLNIKWTMAGKNSTVKASLAWIPDYAPTQFGGDDHLDHFCQSRECDPTTYHNMEMDNTHNRVCNRRATLDVILTSQDLRRVPRRLGLDQNAQVTFVRSNEPASSALPDIHKNLLVLVLDQSYSMGGQPMQNLYSAASQFIDMLDPNYKVAIVSFDHEAYLQTNFIVADDAGKTQLNNAVLKIQPGGYTCIGAGIDMALDLLKNQGRTGGQIVVMTDGFNNRCGPDGKFYQPVFFTTERQEALLAQQVIAHTVAVTEVADENLEDLATYSGGSSYLVADSNSIYDFVLAMQSLLTTITKGSAAPRNLLTAEEQMLTPGKEDFAFHVNVPRDYTGFTLFNVFYSASHAPFAGQIINPKNHKTDCINSPQFLKLTCTSPPLEGSWTVLVSSKASKSNITKPVVMTATVANRDVQVGAKMSSQRLHFGSVLPKPSTKEELYRNLAFYAENNEQKLVIIVPISFKHFAVLNATVYATVQSDNGDVVDIIRLKDDGESYHDYDLKSVDLHENDGVYSGLVSLGRQATLKPGRYSVFVKALGNVDSTFYNPHVVLGNPKTGAFLTTCSSKHIGVAFEQLLQAGTFVVTGDRPTFDRSKRSNKRNSLKSINLPPSQPYNLRIVSTVKTDSSVVFTLSWISVGKNGMVGTPAYYYLNATNNAAIGDHDNSIEGRYHVLKLVEPSADAISNRPMFSSIELPFAKFEHNSAVFFSVVAFGENNGNRRSHVSNIAMARMPNAATKIDLERIFGRSQRIPLQ